MPTTDAVNARVEALLNPEKPQLPTVVPALLAGIRSKLKAYLHTHAEIDIGVGSYRFHSSLKSFRTHIS